MFNYIIFCGLKILFFFLVIKIMFEVRKLLVGLDVGKDKY